MNTPNAQAHIIWTVVSQCKSDRVVYFTNDPQYQPPMEGDWYYCSTYLGELPQGMTLRNCWGWRFRGSQFHDARELAKVSTAEKLLDNNRRVLLRLLKDKINEIRKPFAPSCLDGQALRTLKLQQAHSWLEYLSHPTNGSESDHSGAFLAQVAQARICTLEQAARLIVTRAQAQEQMWLETERFREQMAQLIQESQTQAQLMEIREWLLDAVYPELSRQFKYPLSNTEPIDTSAVLTATARLHEITRIKTQLREVINSQRKHLHTAYVLGEQVWQHKLRQAQQWLSESVSTYSDNVPPGFELLEAYAQAKNWSLDQASQNLLDAASAATTTLLETERCKDQLLARIERLTTLEEIRQLEQELHALNRPLPSTTDA